MHEKLNGELGKKLDDAEWKVAKAHDRAQALVDSHGKVTRESWITCHVMS